MNDANIQSNAAFQAGFANGATLADLQAATPLFTPPTFNDIAGSLWPGVDLTTSTIVRSLAKKAAEEILRAKRKR